MQTKAARVFETVDENGRVLASLIIAETGELILHGDVPHGAVFTERINKQPATR